MNVGRKLSRHLTVAQVKTIFDAAFYAFCVGKPLNTFATSSLQKIGLDAAKGRDFLRHYLKLIRDCLAYRGEKLYFVWVMESHNGLHVHMLLHIPTTILNVFKRNQHAWLAACGRRRQRGDLKSKKIWSSDGPIIPLGNGSSAWYLSDGLMGLLQYLCKGIDFNHSYEMGIPEPRYQGVVVGKRCGISENLSRHRHRFPPLTCERLGLFIAGPEARRRRLVLLFAGTPSFSGAAPIMGYDMKARQVVRADDWGDDE
jgi:hypothetical protein